jgi:hypothetical protein
MLEDDPQPPERDIGGGGEGGGSDAGGKKHKPPKVDLKKLADCIAKLFHVSLADFTPALTPEDGTNKHNVNGSFDGTGRDVLSGPKDADSPIHVVTNATAFDSDFFTQKCRGSGQCDENTNAHGGTPTDLTRVDGQYTNYVAWDSSQDQMLSTQIFELGNTLEKITTGKISADEKAAKALTDCYYGQGTAAKDKQ